MAKKLFFFPEEFGKAFIPKRIRPHLGNYLLKAGITEVPYKLYGYIFYLSLVITYVIYMFKIFPVIRTAGVAKLAFITFASWVVTQIAVILVLALIYYFYLEQKIFLRTQRMEDVLEDFLHLVSENIKGGLTLEEALWNAVKPEFGVLANEIRITAKKVMTGEDVGEALQEFTRKYNSPMLIRSFNLIIQGIKGGGKITYIIDKVIENIIETKKLKKEMAATNLTYIIFVSFVTIAVAPGLFTLSTQFLKILSHFSMGLSGPSNIGINLPLNIGQSTIDPKIFQRFASYAIGIISFFASLIVSLIRKGNIRGGLKLVPLYMATSYAVFLVLQKVAASVVNSFLGI